MPDICKPCKDRRGLEIVAMKRAGDEPMCLWCFKGDDGPPSDVIRNLPKIDTAAIQQSLEADLGSRGPAWQAEKRRQKLSAQAPASPKGDRAAQALGNGRPRRLTNAEILEGIHKGLAAHRAPTPSAPMRRGNGNAARHQEMPSLEQVENALCGRTVREAAASLGVSRAWIEKTRRAAREEGLLDEQPQRCTVPGCGRVLRRDNKSGKCVRHHPSRIVKGEVTSDGISMGPVSEWIRALKLKRQELDAAIEALERL